MICKTCFDAVGRHLPNVAKGERMSLLYSATCYPFGECSEVEKQLEELASVTDGTLGACCAFADDEMTRQMAEFSASESCFVKEQGYDD